MFTPGLKSNFTYPAELSKEFRKRFSNYFFIPKINPNLSPDEYFELRKNQFLKEIELRCAASEFLLNKYTYSGFFYDGI
jgi:hypothetical protein